MLFYSIWRCKITNKYLDITKKGKKREKGEFLKKVGSCSVVSCSVVSCRFASLRGGTTKQSSYQLIVDSWEVPEGTE